jgi:putative ABC transport system permease protein
VSSLLQRLLSVRAQILQSLRFALQAIAAQKLRSTLTLLGIIAGVATVIAMVSLVVGFNRKVIEAFQTLGASRLIIHKYDYGEQNENGVFKKRKNIELADSEAIQRLVPQAAHVSPERAEVVGTETTVKSPKGKELQSGQIVGGYSAFTFAQDFNVADGRFITDADVRHGARICVLGASAARTLFPGSDPIFQDVYIRGVGFKVVGVFVAKGKMLGNDPDSILVIPLTTFDELLPQVKNGDGETLWINVVPHDPSDAEALRDQCSAIMRSRRGLKTGSPDDFQITTSESDLKSLQSIIDGIAAVMLFIASIALVVAGVGVMNIMLVSVTERTREIGIRKAMGATRKDIAAQFLVEAVALTGVGGGLGIILGLSVAGLVKLVFDFPAAAPLWSVLLGFGVSTIVGLTFGLWPAMRAARKDPIEALRYE